MNYYIVGSKYGSQRQGFKDILPTMLDKGVIATGFNHDEDMTEFIGKSKESISKYLKSKEEPRESYSTLKHFLNLKPGDLVAVKHHSAPLGKKARLVIAAFAIVKGIDKPIYRKCEDLGHTIAVDFIERDLNLEFPLGYGQTIHKVDDRERIKLIFNCYSRHVEGPEVESIDFPFKNTDDIPVSATAGFIASMAHNKIQNQLLLDLIETYGKSRVFKEQYYIDVLVELDDKFIVYEVKSSLSADQCLRDALGQIMKYGHSLKKRTSKAVEYVVVGSTEIDDSESSFYNYILSTIDAPIKYLQVQVSH